MKTIPISTTKILDISNTIIDRSVINKSFDIIRVIEGNITSITINTSTQQAYIGDFYGLLSSLNVPIPLYYITTLLNGYEHTADYDGVRNEIMLIEEEVIEKILKYI